MQMSSPEAIGYSDIPRKQKLIYQLFLGSRTQLRVGPGLTHGDMQIGPAYGRGSAPSSIPDSFQSDTVL